MIAAPPSEAYEWDVEQTVEWIVFRGRPPIVFHHQNEETGWSTFEVFRALEARAKGYPRSWRPPNERKGYAPAWMVRALARRWMRTEGLTAQEMLSMLGDPNAKWVSMADATEVERLNMEALADLNDAVRRGLIVAWARPSKSWQNTGNATPRQPLPSNVIDEARSIGWSGSLERHGGESGFDWLHDEGPFYHNTQFRAEDVKRVWPQLAPAGHFDPTPPVSTAMVESAAATDRGVVLQKPPSSSDLTAWYQKRVETWPKEQNPPSGDADFADAKIQFPGVTRTRVRELRREMAPPNWKKEGRRKAKN